MQIDSIWRIRGNFLIKDYNCGRYPLDLSNSDYCRLLYKSCYSDQVLIGGVLSNISFFEIMLGRNLLMANVDRITITKYIWACVYCTKIDL